MVNKERDCRFVRISNPENGAEKADDLQSVARTTDPPQLGVFIDILIQTNIEGDDGGNTPDKVEAADSRASCLIESESSFVVMV